MSRRWGGWQGRLIRLPLCAIATLASACGGDLPEQSAPRCVAPQAAELEAFEGIYETEYFTKNLGSCAGEGPSELDGLSQRGVVVMRSPAQQALVLGRCQGMESCRAVAAGSSERLYEGPQDFDCSVGDGSLYGKDVNTGSLFEGRCTSVSHLEGFVIPESDGVLRLELKLRAGDYAAPKRGCSIAASERASAALTCTYQVIGLRRVEPL